MQRKEDSEVIVISAKIEEEIATLDDEDREMFLEDLGIEEPGLDVLIRTTYDLLGLSTYFYCRCTRSACLDVQTRYDSTTMCRYYSH